MAASNNFLKYKHQTVFFILVKILKTIEDALKKGLLFLSWLCDVVVVICYFSFSLLGMHKCAAILKKGNHQNTWSSKNYQNTVSCTQFTTDGILIEFNLFFSFCTDWFIEEAVIPGRTPPKECGAEAHTDYDGAAVRWGLTFHVESAADCCQACIDQAKAAKPGQIKCNIWVYCPEEAGCYSPDIYEHKHHECWLKQVIDIRSLHHHMLYWYDFRYRMSSLRCNVLFMKATSGKRNVQLPIT